MSMTASAVLGGYIWSTDALYRAKEITAGVPGVTRVVNAMELEREGTRGGAVTQAAASGTGADPGASVSGGRLCSRRMRQSGPRNRQGSGF